MSNDETSDNFRDAYRQRVNAVMDYVEVNLGSDLGLAQLAAVAQFSPYHFHRIFLSVTGETLKTFITRVRLERSAALLQQNSSRQITEIALECGFTSPSSFARSFKDHYGMTPTMWRVHDHGPRPGRRREWQPVQYQVSSTERGWEVVGPEGETNVVRLQQEPARNVAYIRHVGPFQGAAQVFADLFERLYSWARPRGYLNGQAEVFAMYHDNPDLTEQDKLRVSACIAVPPDCKPSQEVGCMQSDGGLYAVASFMLAAADYQQAWDMMWVGWLPESGYEPADGLVFERFDPTGTGERVSVEICIPVRRVS